MRPRLLHSSARWITGQRVTALLAVLLVSSSVPRPAAAATPQDIRSALEKAKKYLYATQARDNWEVVPEPDKNDPDPQWHVQSWQWGGVTACAVYGLLAAGENPKDPRLARAIEWLATQNLRGHYAIAMRCQMYPYLSDAVKYKSLSRRSMVQRDLNLLLNAPFAAGPFAGFYPYYTKPDGQPQPDWYDLSVSQICVLGVWACAESGADVPDSYWKRTEQTWKKVQRDSGGWPYRLDTEERPTMTAAALATLFIAQDSLSKTSISALCNGGVRNISIDRGMLRLDQMINTLLQPGDYGLYGMYGVERIGVASGRKYIGGIDWGAAGAEYLVRHQNPDGSFGVEEPHKNPRKVPDTMFAILFLSRGRAPVVMNKLEYGFGAGGAQTDPWNERPRDVANFTRWTQKQLESLSRGRSSGSRQPTPICTMRRSSTSPAAQRSGSTIGKSTSSALLLKMGV